MKLQMQDVRANVLLLSLFPKPFVYISMSSRICPRGLMCPELAVEVALGLKVDIETKNV
jgi:hypothetical protein